MNDEDSQNLERIRRIYQGPCRGHFPDVNFLLGLIDQHDQRVTDLLNANSQLVAASRVSQGRAEHFAQATDFLTRQVLSLQVERNTAVEERDLARTEAGFAWREAKHYMEMMANAINAVKAPRADKMIADKARVWYRRLTALNNSRNTETNRAYTEAHAALKQECVMQELAQEGQEIGVGYEKQAQV